MSADDRSAFVRTVNVALTVQEEAIAPACAPALEALGG